LIRAEAPSGRPEAAFVLLLLQSLFWLIAGLSAAPFVLGGEIHMAGLVVATLLLALGTCMLAIGVLWRRRRARGMAIALEVVCLFGTAILLLLPLVTKRRRKLRSAKRSHAVSAEEPLPSTSCRYQCIHSWQYRKRSTSRRPRNKTVSDAHEKRIPAPRLRRAA